MSHEVLILRLRDFDWDSEPDDVRAMIELSDLIKEIRKVPMNQLAEILRAVGPKAASEITTIISINPLITIK